MKRKSYGGFTVILAICILAIVCGSLCGMLHIGESYSKEIIPISVSTPVDKISTIEENNFQAENITVKLYIPKPVVKKKTVNKTNTTNSTPSYNNNDTVIVEKNST